MSRIRPETVIEDDLVTVEPGQMAQTVLTVRNTSDQISEYGVSMVPECVAAPWAEADPPSFRLMPGKDQRVTLRFHPPLDSSTPAGSFPYGVLVTPDETQHQAPVVAEGDVAIGAFHALEAELKPPQSRGRWRGRHVVKLHNRGSDDVRVKLSPPEDDEGLSYALAPTTLAIPPRATGEAFLKVRPRSVRMLGRPVDHSFEVSYRRRSDSRAAVGVPVTGVPDSGEVEAQVQGAFTQKPLLSRLLLAGLALLAVGAVLLAVLRPWEKPGPRQAPAPLDNVQMISAADDAIVVAWDNASNVSEVGIREVDCATAADVLPAGEGEVTTVETTGSGRQSFTLEGLEGGDEHCLQARSVADGEASIWVPRPAVQVAVGETLVAPENVDAVYIGACTIDVDWTPVVPEGGDVLYEVMIDGEAQGEPVPAGGVQFADQPEDQDVEVVVQSVAGELPPEPSEPFSVNVPEGCEDDPLVDPDEAREERDGDGGGGGGGEAGGDGGGVAGPGGGGSGGDDDDDEGDDETDPDEEDPARIEDRYWLLFQYPGEDRAPLNSWVKTWQAVGADVDLYEPGEDEPQPRLGRLDVDVLVDEDLGEELPGGEQAIAPGTPILYVDLYGDDEEAEAEARDHCTQLNRVWRDTEDMFFNFLPCFLVHPDGEVERI